MASERLSFRTVFEDITYGLDGNIGSRSLGIIDGRNTGLRLDKSPARFQGPVWRTFIPTDSEYINMITVSHRFMMRPHAVYE